MGWMGPEVSLDAPFHQEGAPTWYPWASQPHSTRGYLQRLRVPASVARPDSNSRGCIYSQIRAESLWKGDTQLFQKHPKGWVILVP